MKWKLFQNTFCTYWGFWTSERPFYIWIVHSVFLFLGYLYTWCASLQMFQALSHGLITLVVLQKHAFGYYTFVFYPQSSVPMWAYWSAFILMHLSRELCTPSKFILTSLRTAMANLESVNSGKMPRAMCKQAFSKIHLLA